MNSSINEYIVPLVLLAVFTTVAYFRGRRKNSWIASWLSKNTEDVLKPIDKNYINIGGSIGYNFKYKLKGMFTGAEGSFTLLPRQSLLYLPISFLTTRGDRYFINLKANGKLAGEGHIVSGDFYSSAKGLIKDFASFEVEKTDKEGKIFYLLWKKNGIDSRLRNLLDNLQNVKQLRHFCCFPENKNFFFLLRPKYGFLQSFLASAVKNLGVFYLKGGIQDESGGTE